MTKVVHFDEVEVVFLADIICRLIKPLQPTLIRLQWVFGGIFEAELFSMRVQH